MATKVGQSLPFLFAHVVVVGQSGTTDCCPPRFSAGPGRVGVAHSVADVVVIADGVERLAFRVVGAPLQQLWVENLLFDVCSRNQAWSARISIVMSAIPTSSLS
jgi:hypothetical protein